MSNFRIWDFGIRNWGRRCTTCGAGSFANSQIQDPKSCKGFTLIELVIVITIIVVMAGVFLTRVPQYQEQAEKAAMEQVAAAIQSALVLRYGTLNVRGAATQQELARLATDNPLSWLQKMPPNYAGEFFDPLPGAVRPGNWMFDLKSHELIYVLNQSDNFVPGADGKRWIRFHVRLGYEPALGRPAQQELASALFEPVVPYHWLE
ncbi:MAG: prepilin-type N-terminal cleavage/methylation domain-containing protein [Pseudomonadota bacterium]